MKNSVIIPNPVTVACHASNTQPRIVSVGRLTPQKNQKLLIDAFKQICNSYPEHTLSIYGDGELKEKLSKMIVDYGIDNKVFLHGNIENVHEEISNSELFVLPSNYEGLSNALLEAMIIGLPCISTDCAGSSEYIVDGKSGLLVPVNDRDALVTAMQKMLDNEELRQRCQKGAKNIIKRVDKDVVLKKWFEIISF